MLVQKDILRSIVDKVNTLKRKKYKLKKGCVISHIPYALKGQKLLAQGNALGLYINNKVAL